MSWFGEELWLLSLLPLHSFDVDSSVYVSSERPRPFRLHQVGEKRCLKDRSPLRCTTRVGIGPIKSFAKSLSDTFMSYKGTQIHKCYPNPISRVNFAYEESSVRECNFTIPLDGSPFEALSRVP